MKFEKVSLAQYLEDSKDDILYKPGSVNMLMEHIREGMIKINGFDAIAQMSPEEIYDAIKLPQRGTMKSAGYDIFAPYDFVLAPGETIQIATGIRVLLDDDKFLFCAPRSGHGFKARMQLDNTVGIIDADYSESKNEGHIKLKLTNDSHTGKVLEIKRGTGMAQAIIMKYFTVEEDNVTTTRDGGFGSTDKRR